MHTITILKITDSKRPHVLSSVAAVEGTKMERWGLCRERAEFLRPFVGRTMSKRRFAELLSERL
jgi:hypothetical protein